MKYLSQLVIPEKILYHFKVKNVKSCRIKKEMSDYAFTFV